MNQIINEKQYISNKLNVPYEDLSQAYLRAETALTTHTSIRFDVQAGKVPSSDRIVTERLLELNDKFVVTHFRIGVKYIASDTPTDLQHLTTDVQHYADPTIFATTNAPNVAAIFNSNLNWTIDRKEFLPQFPISAFRRVPDTQTAANADYTASGITQVNSEPNGLFGFYPCEPVILNGRQTIDTLIELGASVAFDDASATSYAVLELRGYLLVNATND